MNATAKIVIRRKLSKNNQYPIVLRVTINRKSKYYSTPFYSKLNQWDSEMCQLKPRTPNAPAINYALNKIRENSMNIIAGLEHRYNGLYNLLLFDKIYNKENLKSYSFKELFVREAKAIFENGQINYARTMNDTIAALLKFKPKLDQYNFENIDLDFLIEFEIFLRKRGATDGGIAAYMRNIRTIYNRAIKYEIIQPQFYPFRDFKLSKFKKRDIRKALSKTELSKFINFDISQLPAAKNAWYIYIFSYYARGMNFTDIAELKWSDIEDNGFAYQRNKTDVLLKVELPSTPLMREILDYYKTYRPFKTKHIFPILTKDISEYDVKEMMDRKASVRSYYNKQLKLILKLCDIEKNITFYTARHTFATHMLREDINIAIIKQSLGHKKLSTTENYLEDFTPTEVNVKINNLFQ